PRLNPAKYTASRRHPQRRRRKWCCLKILNTEDAESHSGRKESNQLRSGSSRFRSGRGAEGGLFGGLLHDPTRKPKGLGRLQRAGSFVVSCLHQAFLNGIQSPARTLQNDQEILLGDRPVRRMNELPP